MSGIPNDDIIGGSPRAVQIHGFTKLFMQEGNPRYVAAGKATQYVDYLEFLSPSFVPLPPKEFFEDYPISIQALNDAATLNSASGQLASKGTGRQIDGNFMKLMRGSSTGRLPHPTKNTLMDKNQNTSALLGRTKTLAERFPKYHKAIPPGAESIDTYRIFRMFNVTDPCIQHAIKKLLLPGVRTGGKSLTDDINEARATLDRWVEMAAEDHGPNKVQAGHDHWADAMASVVVGERSDLVRPVLDNTGDVAKPVPVTKDGDAKTARVAQAQRAIIAMLDTSAVRTDHATLATNIVSSLVALDLIK